MQLVSSNIQAYIDNHSTPISVILGQIAAETQATMATHRMMSSPRQGQFLRFMVELSRAKRILEIGTYTGYSALAMAEGLPKDGELITCEASDEYASIAQQYFNKSDYKRNICMKSGKALDIVPELTGVFDIIFIDADKQNYLNYYNLVLSKLTKQGIIIFDNTLWSGEVLSPKSKNAIALNQLNKELKVDQRIEVLMLPIRDGLSLVKKRNNLTRG